MGKTAVVFDSISSQSTEKAYFTVRFPPEKEKPICYFNVIGKVIIGGPVVVEDGGCLVIVLRGLIFDLKMVVCA
jgi:hypothetical protein